MDTSNSPTNSQPPQEARQEDITRRAVAEMKAGLGRSATEMLAEMRQVLAEAIKRQNTEHAYTQ